VQREPETSASFRAALTAWQILYALLLLSRALTGAIDYDEDQYVAAGVMARQLMLYRDFIYLQSPADPLLLAGLYALTGGWYLLTARLLSGVLAACVFGLTIALVRRSGAGRGLATLLASLALLSPFLDRAIATSRNDILPLTLFLAGVLLYLEAPKRGRAFLAAAGLCVGLAVEAKISYVFAPVMLLLHAGWTGSDRLRRLVPLAAGIAVAALPGLYYLAATPDNFLFDLLGFHMKGPAAWYERQGQAELLDPGHRLAALGVLLLWGANASLTLLVAGLAAFRVVRRAGFPAQAGLLLLLTVPAALVGYQPSPSWPMYYAPLAPLLAALAATLAADLKLTGAGRWLAAALVALVLIPALFPLWHRASGLTGLAQPSTWPGIVMHRQALAVRDALTQAGIEGEVATLFPIHALDAVPVPPEFASGPFFFRTADLYPDDRIAQLHGAGAASLDRLFAQHPPAALLGGLAKGQWQGEMDASLRDYAERNGYGAVALDQHLWPDGSWLYLRGTRP
jgi:hypothetical protein